MSSGLALSIPAKETSAWVVETSPKETLAWLATLPLADIASSAREIYQSLYTLNRLELAPAERLKLMELYREPLVTVDKGLGTHLGRVVLPLSPKKRQLAEFLRQLHMEMATGYKCVLHDIQQARMLWGKKKLQGEAAYFAMRYLGQVLQQSYQVYIPCPAGSWREIHELYRFAELNQWFPEYNPDPELVLGQGSARLQQAPIYHLYLQIVLLGLCHPYQLPQGEWRHISEFLQHWAGEAVIRRELNLANPAGHFLVDLSKDSPPLPYPRDVDLQPFPHLRALNALGLASTVQNFINQLKKGVPSRSLNLGTECLDSACLDMLRRMLRFWGLAIRRQQSRSKRRGYCFVATGINAVHFFASGQKPFTAPDQPAAAPFAKAMAEQLGGLNDEAAEENPARPGFIELEQPRDIEPTDNKNPGLAHALTQAREIYRVDRWQVVDESVGGQQLANPGNPASYVRVGDFIGLQDVANADNWRAAVVRWMKSPDSNRIEIGVAMLAAQVQPVAVKAPAVGINGGHYTQALLLPPVEAMRRPATLIVPRGFYRLEAKLWLLRNDSDEQEVKILKLLERTGSFEHLLFAAVEKQ